MGESKFSKCGHSVAYIEEIERYTVPNKNKSGIHKGLKGDEHHLVLHCNGCDANYDIIISASKFSDLSHKLKSLSQILAG